MQTTTSNGVTDTPGFQAAAVACDIRQKGSRTRLDLALLFSPRPCQVAAVFTRNAVRAAPVQLCEEILLRSSRLHGVVVNSGNANACTGARGMAHAREMILTAARACHTREDSFLVCSTGRIGKQLPMDTILEGIATAAANLRDKEEAGRAAAEAILTSDTRTKTCTVRFETSKGVVITLSGMAKGAGMIHPNMATMLAFLTTDADIVKTDLQRALHEAVSDSFNATTVDGDTSTNDSVLLFANGHAGTSLDPVATPGDWKRWCDALKQVCHSLASMIVGDGERITKVVTVIVRGARTRMDAEKVARGIGNSLLVKSSWFGNDPNWGRLACAAGASGAFLEEARLDLFYDEVPVLHGGEVLEENLPRWKEIVTRPKFSIHLDLNAGEGSFQLLATDLTDGYVNFNKSE